MNPRYKVHYTQLKDNEFGEEQYMYTIYDNDNCIDVTNYLTGLKAFTVSADPVSLQVQAVSTLPPETVQDLRYTTAFDLTDLLAVEDIQKAFKSIDLCIAGNDFNCRFCDLKDSCGRNAVLKNELELFHRTMTLFDNLLDAEFTEVI